MAYLNSVLNPFIYGFMSKNFRLYIKTICAQMVSYTLCTRDSPGSFGSTKSDVSKQTRLSRTPGGAAFVVRMDKMEAAGHKKASNLKDMAGNGLLPTTTATRKISDPKTECVSVNDTWPASTAVTPVDSGTTMTAVQTLTPL